MNKLMVGLISALMASSVAFAADGSAATASSGYSTILFFVAMLVIFYFLLIRPQSKKNKELKKMMENLQKGSEVVTNGGIIGKIHRLGDNFIEIEIAENTVVKVQRNAILGVLPKGSTKTD